MPDFDEAISHSPMPPPQVKWPQSSKATIAIAMDVSPAPSHDWC
jgi:hypothetical protein